MATKKQIQANRKNGTHSTGPTSDAGKAATSQNSLKHGLASSELIIEGESEDDFNTMLTALLADHKAEGVTEILLVQDMAKHHWLADRALRMQSFAIQCEAGRAPNNLAILIRYQTANERAFQRAFATLTLLRKTRLAENGFASKNAPASPQAAAPAPQTAPADPTFQELGEKYLQGFRYNHETRHYQRFKEAS